MFTSLVTCSKCGHDFETMEKNVSVCDKCSYKAHMNAKYATRLEKRFILSRSFPKGTISVVFYPERDMYTTPVNTTCVYTDTLRHVYREYIRDGYRLR